MGTSFKGPGVDGGRARGPLRQEGLRRPWDWGERPAGATGRRPQGCEVRSRQRASGSKPAAVPEVTSNCLSPQCFRSRVRIGNYRPEGETGYCCPLLLSLRRQFSLSAPGLRSPQPGPQTSLALLGLCTRSCSRPTPVIMNSHPSMSPTALVLPSSVANIS